MREGCRDPQRRRMALGQATRHLQCPNGSPSPAQIGRGAAQISPATAANRASGERMDDPRARARSRHAAADPLHLGPEGTSILPQHRRRLETRRAGARRSRDDRGVEGDTSHAAALAPPAATACQQQRRPHHRVLRVAMTGRYRLSSVWRNPTPSRVNQPEVVSIESYAWAEVAVVEGFGFAKVERESAFKSMSPRDREEAATRAAAILAEVRRPPSTLNNPK